MVVSTCFLLWKWTLNSQLAQENHNGWAAIIDKHHRLDSLHSPKLVLVGGSNVMFGLNSRLLSDSLHIPVVNMGLGGALGLSFFLNEVKSSLHQGDIVLVSVEHYLDKGDYDAQLFTANLYPPAQQYIHYKSELDSLTTNWSYRLRKIRNKIILPTSSSEAHTIADTTAVYFREAFDKQGDMVSHVNNRKPSELDDRSEMQATDYSKAIKKLNDFANFATQKGVRVFFSYPSYAKQEADRNQEALRQLDKQLRMQLHFPCIDSPFEQVYDDSLFFDTVYHLSDQGRTIRTLRVIQSLKKALNSTLTY